MKKIGMLVAVEIQAVLDKYGSRLEEVDCSGYAVKILRTENYELYILKSGAGEISAAAGVQFLITKYGVDFILNFGVVGGLTPEMALAKTCVVEKVVHYDYDTSEIDGTRVGQYNGYEDEFIHCDKALVEAALKLQPELKAVTCASADKFVGDPARKAALHEQFGADICEMEAAGILLTCRRNGVPCLMIKTVSDSISGGADEFTKEVNRSAGICLDVAEGLMEIL